jgi:hypothetical protein
VFSGYTVERLALCPKIVQYLPVGDVTFASRVEVPIMPADAVIVAVRKPEGRARVSNGKRLFLGDVDGRSVAARRLRDVLNELTRPLGGLAALAEPIRQIARRAAALSVQAELLEAAMAKGEAVDPIAFATVTNTLARLLDRLAAAAQKSKPREPTLADLLAERDAH